MHCIDHLGHGWAIKVFEGHCPACFLTIPALATAGYLDQEFLVNQKLGRQKSTLSRLSPPLFGIFSLLID